MIEHVVVMAAVPNTRIESLTRTRPKAMLPILGKPMITRVMEGYYNTGIRRFTVVVGEQEGSVVEWLVNRWHPDAQLSFAPQGHQRGTASTLFAIRSLIDEPFIITSCDILLPEQHVVDLCRYFETHSSDVAVLSLLYAPDEISEAADVLLGPRGDVMYISEQPAGAHQDYRAALPVYGFTPQVFEYLDKVPLMEKSGQRIISAAIQEMIDDQQLVGAVETEWRIRLDTPEDLLQANTWLMEELQMTGLLSDVPTSVEIISPVYVDPGVVVGKGTILGPNVYLETGSVIGPNVVIRNSLVLGSTVAGNQSIEGQIVSSSD